MEIFLKIQSDKKLWELIKTNKFYSLFHTVLGHCRILLRKGQNLSKKKQSLHRLFAQF